MLFWDAYSQTLERVIQRGRIVFDWLVDAGGILAVQTSHGIGHQRGIFGTLAQGAGLVEAGGEGNHAPARDATVAGLKTGNATEGSGLTNRAAGIGTGCHGTQVGGDRSG